MPHDPHDTEDGNPFAPPREVEEGEMPRMAPTLRTTMSRVFVVHLILVLLVGGLSVEGHCRSGLDADETHLIWVFLLIVDFPLSILVILTSGPSVVSMPHFFSISETDWLFREVLWPALVFQVLGTINWTVIRMIIQKISDR